MNITLKVIISGIDFNAVEALDHLSMDQFLIEDNEDKNSLTLISKDYPMVDEYVDEYDQMFVNFFEINYGVLKKLGADDFKILFDVRFREQCNFEIFSRTQLKTLAKYGVSFPMRVTYDKSMILRGYFEEGELE